MTKLRHIKSLCGLRNKYLISDLSISLVDSQEIVRKKSRSLGEKHAILHELSGKEPVRQVIIIKNKSKKSMRLVASQIKEIFSKIGFNVDPIFSKKHFSDFEAVMNVGGMSIPGWVKFARFVSKIFPSKEKSLLFKLSPGKDRLHIRLFKISNSSWLITAHTDHNWLSLNLKKIYKSHVGSGAGDYITGTTMMHELLLKFIECSEEKREITSDEINAVVKNAYDKSLYQKSYISLPSDIKLPALI